MSEDTCAFCLGGSTERPPFGSLKDAQDLVHPCSTCSLVTHRKCLIDWFNSMPGSQISSVSTARPVNEERSETNETDTNTGFNRETERSMFGVSLRSRWLTLLGQYNTGVEEFDSDESLRILEAIETIEAMDGTENTENTESRPNTRMQNTRNPAAASNQQNRQAHIHASIQESISKSDRIFLSTPCPQCKTDITFQIERRGILALNNVLRNTICDTVQYSGILLGLTGAATGLVTMGYVGLARCGVSIIDALVPVSLISPLFRGSSATSTFSRKQSLLALVSSTRPYNLANQLKFQHIPLLPVMLYRMRYLLILDCLFKKGPLALATDWIGELLLCNYVSSLGNHTLVKQIYQNARTLLARVVKDRSSLLQVGLLFRNIDWWDPSVMVGATIPARWLYDLFYRLTINRIHFNINASTRPTDIANTLDPEDLSKLETLESQLAGVKYCISQRMRHAEHAAKKCEVSRYSTLPKEVGRLFRDGTLKKLVSLKVFHWYYKSKACLLHDYASNLLYRLAIVTGITTFLWPFVSADLGKLIYALFLLKVPFLVGADKDKLMFLSNLLGMAVVALLKDMGNLFMCHQKARQLSQLSVVTQRQTPSPITPDTPHNISRIPGAYA